MSISTDVQGLALALYGAFAGGDLQRLINQATANGSKSVANSLIQSQSVVLNKNLTDSDAWADVVLTNLGLTSQNPAYVSAKVWFLLQSALNRPRSDIVTEAVGFLLGTAEASNPDPKYVGLAKSFRSDVVNGVEWSAQRKQNTDGALFADLKQLQSQVTTTRSEKTQAIKSDVQALAVALFGGFAGGHFSDLIGQAQLAGTPTLANGLAGLQSALLKRDFSSADAWSDFVLGNLGIAESHAAYPSAKAWFLAQTSLGRDRGAIVVDAIEYLQALPSMATADARFLSVATPFLAKVSEGIRWSEDTSAKGGSKVLDLVSLQGQIKAPSKPQVTDSVLKDVLSSLFEALQVQKTFLEGGAPQNAALIEASEVSAESAIRDALNNGEFIYNRDESSSGQTKAANDLENAAANAARDTWTATQSSLQQLVANQKSQLDQISVQAAGLVESLARSNQGLSELTETLYQSETDLFELVEQGNAGFAGGTVAFNYDIETRVFELLEMRNDGDVVIASFARGSWSAGPAYRAAAESFKQLSESYAAAYSGYLAKESELVQILRPLERLNENFTSAATVDEVDAYTLVTDEADQYLGAFSGLQDTNLLIAKALTALALVNERRTGDINEASLQKNVDVARSELVTLGYNLVDLVGDSTIKATSKVDLYNVSKLVKSANQAKISEFGLQDDDALIVFGYSLSSSASGSDAALEYKVEQQGQDTVVTFENAANSFGAGAGGLNGTFRVTLTGVDSSSLAYADHLILG